MEDQSEEPVLVYVRIRPENLPSTKLNSPTNVLNRSTSSSNGSFSNFSSNSIIRETSKCVLPVNDQTIRLIAPDGSNSSRKSVSAIDDKVYTFDKIFPEDSTQEDIYKSVSPLVKATVRGYNTTIFAYGCTGSGKSFTMTGNSTNPGIIPRAISEIFSIIEETAAQESDVFFYVRMSYVELYNNNFRNLLEFASKELALKESEKRDTHRSAIGLDNEETHVDVPHSANHTQSSIANKASSHPINTKGTDKIEVRESTTAGTFLAGSYLRIPVTSAKEAFQIIAKGNKYRAVGVTQCNDESSRSHAVLTIHVESRVSTDHGVNMSSSSGLQPTSELRLGKMHLVDLAGSERVALSGAEGTTLIETQNINSSLTALGDVLQALSKNAEIIQKQSEGGGYTTKTINGMSHRVPMTLVQIPYRNSKLTFLLKDSLGDGDVQGIRSIVRSKGNDLQSSYWMDISSTILPFHRAIAGLHFHGNENLLLTTIECLYQLNANINAIDLTGNTGSNVNIRNNDGDTPLLTECRRLRTASIDVIDTLLRAGANANDSNQSNSNITNNNTNISALTLVLLTGATSASSSVDKMRVSTTSISMNTISNVNSHANEEKVKSSGRKVWIKLADLLIKSGAKWDNEWRNNNGYTQLHLLLLSFPPSNNDFTIYYNLLSHALDYGNFFINTEDIKDRCY
eukprot:gene18771-24538_t